MLRLVNLQFLHGLDVVLFPRNAEHSCPLYRCLAPYPFISLTRNNCTTSFFILSAAPFVCFGFLSPFPYLSLSSIDTANATADPHCFANNRCQSHMVYHCICSQ